MNVKDFDFIKDLSFGSVVSLIAIFFCLIALINKGWGILKELKKNTGFKFKSEIEKGKTKKIEKSDHEMLLSHDHFLKETLTDFNTKLNQNIDRLSNKIDDLDKREREQEERNESSTRASLKNSLYRSYKFYKTRYKETGKKEWTKIESDGFWSLFHDYEAHGGNGYAHETIEPYMLEFTEVDEIEFEEHHDIDTVLK